MYEVKSMYEINNIGKLQGHRVFLFQSELL